jgi:hypothetical protein
MPKTSKPPLWRRPRCERWRVNFRLGSTWGFGEARRIRLWHVADDVRIGSKVRYRGRVRGLSSATAYGASRPLRRIPVIVSFLNP